MTWRGLSHLRKALPVVVTLTSGGSMVLASLEGSDEALSVILLDPTAGEDATLVVDRQNSESAWTREVVLLRRNYDLADEDQPYSLGHDRGAHPAGTADCQGPRHLLDGAQSVRDRADHVLAPPDRPGAVLRQSRHLRGALHRDGLVWCSRRRSAISAAIWCCTSPSGSTLSSRPTCSTGSSTCRSTFSSACRSARSPAT